MTFSLKLQGNSQNLMRQCGYFFEKEDKGELAFCRIIGPGRSGYPRFHIYLATDKVSGETRISLHLDQKKPIYQRSAAHAGEYEGEMVEKEAERIKQILGPMVQR